MCHANYIHITPSIPYSLVTRAPFICLRNSERITNSRNTTQPPTKPSSPPEHQRHHHHCPNLHLHRGLTSSREPRIPHPGTSTKLLCLLLHLNSLRDATSRDDAVDGIVADDGGIVAAAAADEIDGIAAYRLLGGFHATELYRSV